MCLRRSIWRNSCPERSRWLGKKSLQDEEAAVADRHKRVDNEGSAQESCSEIQSLTRLARMPHDVGGVRGVSTSDDEIAIGLQEGRIYSARRAELMTRAQ